MTQMYVAARVKHEDWPRLESATRANIVAALHRAGVPDVTFDPVLDLFLTDERVEAFQIVGRGEAAE